MTAKVLFGREQISAHPGFDQLAAHLPGWEIASCPPDKVADHLDGVDVICPLGARIGVPIISNGSFGLVHQFGVGLERVDIATATQLGVLVARVPGDVGGNADSCAELAVLHLLALFRRLDASRAALAESHWLQRPVGRSLLDATVLIVGLGAIGTALARRLAPFGPRLLGVRARPELGGPAGLDLVAGPDQLPDLLAQADAVMCCAVLHDGNAGMFGQSEFAAMRPGAVFVNVARGGLVDEAALLAALETGQVGAAGLDVFSSEPADPQSPLIQHPNVIATPHIGWHTDFMFRQTSEAFAANLMRYSRGEQPLWTVNSVAARRS
ncbi:MAG TPA: NAD(P)-dependent oxidoreductase [Streptosporangiaceae bacterium]|nr:NAD(P)-dependent oxidoreductase [Streptosporangiaceae bacterium]